MQKLAQEGGFGHHHHQSRPTTAKTGGHGITSRSQTVPSNDLRKALEEMHKAVHCQSQSHTSQAGLQTLESGEVYMSG